MLEEPSESGNVLIEGDAFLTLSTVPYDENKFHVMIFFWFPARATRPSHNFYVILQGPKLYDDVFQIVKHV